MQHSGGPDMARRPNLPTPDLRSYLERYRLETAYSFMVALQYCPTGRPDHQHHNLISHSAALSCHWTSQSLPYPNNAEHLARKWQVYIFKTLVWLDQCSNPWGSDSQSPKMGDGQSTHSAIPSYSIYTAYIKLTSLRVFTVFKLIAFDYHISTVHEPRGLSLTADY